MRYCVNCADGPLRLNNSMNYSGTVCRRGATTHADLPADDGFVRIAPSREAQISQSRERGEQWGNSPNGPLPRTGRAEPHSIQASPVSSAARASSVACKAASQNREAEV